MDKPSKYARSSSSGDNNDNNDKTPQQRRQPKTTHYNSSSVAPSAQPTLSRSPLHKRIHSTYQNTTTTTTTTTTSPHRRTSSSSSLPPPLSSPPNPFLHPPPHASFSPRTTLALHPRTSTEWLADRAAFFHPSPASSSLATSDIEALEAGTAPLTGRKWGREEAKTVEGQGALERGLCWLDHGLGMVDGAVARVASGWARWADDGEGEGSAGALWVLPVARTRRGGADEAKGKVE